MAISEDHNVKDGIKKVNTVHDLNPWIETILENSEPQFTDVIGRIHDIVVSSIMKSEGYIDREGGELYKQLFLTALKNNNLKLNENMQIVEDVIFVPIQNPYENLQFKREEKQYRRNRKKINWINHNTLVDVITMVDENKSELIPFTIRKRTKSNPEKDKVVMITNLVYNTVITLNKYCTPKLNDNQSLLIEEFYSSLIDDIVSTKEDEVYDKTKLIKLIQNIRKEQKEIALDLYYKIYDKVNMTPKSDIVKKDISKFNLKRQPKEIQRLYTLRDPHLNRLMNRLDYLTLTDIV